MRSPDDRHGVAYGPRIGTVPVIATGDLIIDARNPASCRVFIMYYGRHAARRDRIYVFLFPIVFLVHLVFIGDLLSGDALCCHITVGDGIVDIPRRFVFVRVIFLVFYTGRSSQRNDEKHAGCGNAPYVLYAFTVSIINVRPGGITKVHGRESFRIDLVPVHGQAPLAVGQRFDFPVSAIPTIRCPVLLKVSRSNAFAAFVGRRRYGRIVIYRILAFYGSSSLQLSVRLRLVKCPKERSLCIQVLVVLGVMEICGDIDIERNGALREFYSFQPLIRTVVV